MEENLNKTLSLFILFFLIFLPLGLNAQTWSAIERLTWNSGDSQFASIASDSGTGIHVVWQDITPGQSEIYYKHSTDGGSTWSSLVRLTWSSDQSRTPAIAAFQTDGSLQVVWSDAFTSDIFFKRSTDSGTTWTPLKRLTWNPEQSKNPVVALDAGNNAHVIWADKTPGNFEIFYKRSTNKYNNWGVITRLTWNNGLSDYPSLYIDATDGMHLVWEDLTPGNREIFYKRSTNHGTTWSAPVRLTWTSGNSYNPCIAANSGSELYLVWRDYTPGNGEIYFKSSTDLGITWSAPMRLTWNSGDSRDPVVFSGSSGSIDIVWSDDTPGNYEIYHKRSTDSGSTWGPINRLTWNPNPAQNPSITKDSAGGLHIVWEDEPQYAFNYEIIYKNYK